MDNRNNAGNLHSNELHVDRSGNSDVDVDVNINIQVDTTPIAYAMLYSLLAQRQLSKSEFMDALKLMDEYVNKNDRK